MNNRLVYFKSYSAITPDILEKIKKLQLEKIEEIKEWKRLGLFSKGLGDKEILDYLKTIKDRENRWNKEEIEKADSLTLSLLNIFLIRIFDLFKPNLKLKIEKLKIEEDPYKLIEEVQIDLKSKSVEEFEKYFKEKYEKEVWGKKKKTLNENYSSANFFCSSSGNCLRFAPLFIASLPSETASCSSGTISRRAR